MKTAIIGSGISGLGAAYLLHPHHEITVYEKNHYIGGHSRTITVSTPEGDIAVDTGFIVFNYRNYPHLTGLFDLLKVPVEKSDMSFAASIHNAWLEYGTKNFAALFAQKRNFLRPAYWQMIRDILRFNRQALRYLDDQRNLTLGECLAELKMGRWFSDYFLLAMGGAIWSTPLSEMLNFPAKSFIRFFYNHGLLTVDDQPQWYTVTGGSKEYVTRLTEGFRERIKINCGVVRVERTASGVLVTDTQGQTVEYDQVIFACHADQALALLSRPTPEEAEALGACRYQPNRVVLHSDTSFMPRRKGAWASWVYLLEDGREDNRPVMSLSYWMNLLQNLKTQTPLIVTLNPGREPDPTLVHDEVVLEHPLFDDAAIAAQKTLDTLQGKNRTWYCGAYHRYGFHEDGLMSAVHVAELLGVKTPWRR